jgi:hypothetical protein
MKLKEMVRKKFDIDRFISEGEEENIRAKASSLQPEMAMFELSTKKRYGIPYMGIGTGYEMNAISSDENIYIPRDIEEKFKSLYAKYSDIKSPPKRSDRMNSGIILLIGLF